MAPEDPGIDPELLASRARQGDTLAFSRLVELYEEKAIHTAYSFLGNMEDARDAAQEAFVKSYQALGSFKGGSKFSTWVIRIVINQCKDVLRKKKTRNFFSWVPQAGEEEKDPVQNLESRAPDSRKQIMDREIEAAVREAMEKLPFQQKSAFALRYLEGMSLEEISETMGLSTGAVKAHLWQAGQKMKKSLQQWMPEAGVERG